MLNLLIHTALIYQLLPLRFWNRFLFQHNALARSRLSLFVGDRDEWLHHSSEKFRKQFATSVHPSEASPRGLGARFAHGFVRCCIFGSNLRAAASNSSGFQLPWADMPAVENDVENANVLLSCAFRGRRLSCRPWSLVLQSPRTRLLGATRHFH